MSTETAALIVLVVIIIVLFGTEIIVKAIGEDLDRKHNGIASKIGGILLAIFILFKVIEAFKVTYKDYKKREEIQKEQWEKLKKIKSPIFEKIYKESFPKKDSIIQ